MESTNKDDITEDLGVCQADAVEATVQPQEKKVIVPYKDLLAKLQQQLMDVFSNCKHAGILSDHLVKGEALIEKSVTVKYTYEQMMALVNGLAQSVDDIYMSAGHAFQTMQELKERKDVI